MADWGRKKNLQAKIRARLKIILVRDYALISKLSDSILQYAENVYGGGS